MNWPIIVQGVEGMRDGIYDPKDIPPHIVAQVLKNGWKEGPPQDQQKAAEDDPEATQGEGH